MPGQCPSHYGPHPLSTAARAARWKPVLLQSLEGRGPGTQGLPLCRPVGKGRAGLGNSLIWEELQGPAAGGDLAHGVAAALTEAGRRG